MGLYYDTCIHFFQDFGINSVQDLVHIYDKIVAKIIDPMIGAVKAFGDIIHLFKNGGIKKIFDTLVSTVKNLPHILGDVTKRLKEFVDEIFSIAGSVIMEEIKLIVGHVRAFVDGVKQDILKFYHVSSHIINKVCFTLTLCTLGTFYSFLSSNNHFFINVSI